MHIRPALQTDAAAIWRVLEPTARAGETLALDRDVTEAQALAVWLAPDREVFVAEDGGEVVGVCYTRPNQSGGGRHVCNAGYVTSEAARGRGVARAMAQHTLGHARRRGYRAMQFNFVISVNAPAVALWRSLGFEIVGRLPQAFLHPRLGYTDALVMFRSLSEEPTAPI